MIRINTAPLGMQNLLSGNRKLYKGGLCDGFEPILVDKQLILSEEHGCGPIDAPLKRLPTVIYCENTGNVYYRQP